MVIWPKKISPDDAGWRQACALMQVLAFDPRRPMDRTTRHLSRYFESADDLLERPNIRVDRRLVPAPYFSYCLRFNVSASVHGSIPIDDEAQLTEFKRAVNAALQGELTTAERKSWEAEHQRLDTLRAAERRRWDAYKGIDSAAVPENAANDLHAVAADEAAKASRFYAKVRNDIEAPRRFDGIARPSLSRHEEVLAGLIRLGTTLLHEMTGNPQPSGIPG